MEFEEKRKKITQLICKVIDTIDVSKQNGDRYRQFLSDMSKPAFTKYMNYIKEGKVQIYIVAPNLEIVLDTRNLLKAAKIMNTTLFSKLYIKDQETGKTFLTNEKYPILQLPIRRMEQFLDNKLKVPNDDKSIDGLTGQVSGADSKSSLSAQESRVIHARGLDKSLLELLKIRGGDVATYGEFRRQLEETGSCDTDNISSVTRVKSGHSMHAFLIGMHIDNDF